MKHLFTGGTEPSTLPAAREAFTIHMTSADALTAIQGLAHQVAAGGTISLTFLSATLAADRCPARDGDGVHGVRCEKRIGHSGGCAVPHVLGRETECIECGAESAMLTKTIEDHPFPYGVEPETITLVAKNVPVWRCKACGFEWLNAGAQAIIDRAAQDHRRGEPGVEICETCGGAVTAGKDCVACSV